jgi:hypothetical protein
LVVKHHRQPPLLDVEGYVNDPAQVSDAVGNEFSSAPSPSCVKRTAVSPAAGYVEEHLQMDLVHDGDIGDANGRQVSHSVTALGNQPQLNGGNPEKDVADVVV